MAVAARVHVVGSTRTADRRRVARVFTVARRPSHPRPPRPHSALHADHSYRTDAGRESTDRTTTRATPRMTTTTRRRHGVAALLLAACAILAFASVPCVHAANTPAALFKSLFTSYDGQLRPNINTSLPVTIYTAMRINLLYNVDSKEETFQLDLFVNEYWVDTRLAFDATKWVFSDTLRIPSSYSPWVPDTFFFNAVKCLTIVDTALTLSSDGTVFWSRHQSCTFHSAFDLLSFPFDSQTLGVRRTSFSYTQSELVLKFLTSSGFRPDPSVDFTNSLWDFKYAFSNSSSLSFINTHSANAYLEVSRKSLAYILKMILPMFLLVLLSTLSYAVDPGSPPARVAFSVALILSIVTFNSVVSADLPKINYATLIDWYVWYCFLFVVIALGEYSFVNNLAVSQKYGAEFPYLVDDFALWTAPYTWMVINLYYWPLYDSVAIHVLLAIVWSTWIAINLYRVFWWNRSNGKRGLWAPLKAFYYYSKREWRRRRDPAGYAAAIAAEEAAVAAKEAALDAEIEMAEAAGTNVFDDPPPSSDPLSADALLCDPPSMVVADPSDPLASASPDDEPNPFDDDLTYDEPLLPTYDHALDDGLPFDDDEEYAQLASSHQPIGATHPQDPEFEQQGPSHPDDLNLV